MNEHDARIMAPKLKSVHDPAITAEWSQRMWFCHACGAASDNLTTHHIIGGRGGRSDEWCNYLRLCWHPCHVLVHESVERLPKITLGIALTMKLLAVLATSKPTLPKLLVGLLAGYPNMSFKHSADEWNPKRLEALHGRNLPDLEPIPKFFLELFARNRPEFA